MSETDFLKLKKHDNPETNTEKFDIENYLNGNWDKINENAKEVNTNISNINSKNTELEKELKEAQEDFYQNSIRGQASGEYIHVEDSSNCRAKIGIGGNSKQETSPSPDYPSPVKTVGSNVNIFDLESYYNVVPSANCTKQLLKNGIRLNFTAGNDAYIGDVYNTGTTMTENKRPACIKVKPNTTYTLKMSSAPKCYMSFFDKNYKSVKDYVQITSSNYIFTTNSSTCYIYLRLGYQNRTSGLTSYDFTDIKCVEGTEVGEYSKYGQGCVEVTKCNKNLFNVSVLNDCSQNGITLTKNEGTNKIKLNGTPTKDFTIYSKDLDVNMFEIGEKYSLSKDFSNITFNFEVFENNSNTASIWATSITMQKSYTRVRVYVQGKANTTFNNQEIALQLEKGNATEIVAHQSQTYIIPTQQPMRSIGDTRDTFIKKNNKWYEHHPVIRKIFDGSENFTATTGWGNTTYQIIINGMASPNSNSIMGKALCSHFTIKSGSDMYYNVSENAFAICSGNILRIRNIDITTLEDFKAWLQHQYNAGTPVYVDYVLETPLDIECTEEQSNILDELNNARTYKNVTNITTDSKAILDLDYAKDLETLLNNMQALAVNNASEGV